MRRHGPVIAHCTDSEDFPKFSMVVFRIDTQRIVEIRPILVMITLKVDRCESEVNILSL